MTYVAYVENMKDSERQKFDRDLRNPPPGVGRSASADGAAAGPEAVMAAFGLAGR